MRYVLPCHSAHHVRARCRKPPTSQWFHAYRLAIITPTLYGRRAAYDMCISDMATAPSKRARASRLSAAAVPRDVLEGRATSTCVSGHCTQPRGVASPSCSRALGGPFKDEYTFNLDSWLKVFKIDHESHGRELRVPEHDADIAQSRPGS
jgi:hypothetical protein